MSRLCPNSTTFALTMAQRIEIAIYTDFIQLDQLLKRANVVRSGGEAHVAVEEGLVSLNGEQESRKRAKIRPGDVVEFEDFIIEVKSM